MRWQGENRSSNVEDRRGQGGGLGRILLKGPGGIVLIFVILIAGYFGIDLSPLITGGGGNIVSQSAPYQPTAEEEEMADFTSIALKMTEDAWTDIFQEEGRVYAPPKLVLYTVSTTTSCGYGKAAMGPFYCPADQTVYIDLSFYEDMKKRLGGGGDFAQGYVLAHEVGHHIQHLLGIDQRVRQLQQRASQAQINHLSVLMELQADCFAGVWGNYVEKRGLLDPGDVEQALRTAEAIGDDRLQKESGGRVVPDSFTHGTSEQRYMWFKRGYDSGDPSRCDTFASDDL